jgi:thiol-disulfide isomerase/thioredoxin
VGRGILVDVHRKLRLVFVPLVVGALLVAGCGDDSGSTEAAAADGPTFEAATLDGGELASAELDGPTVLWFWAPWCTICRAEGPGVADAAEQLGDDVQVVGVAGRGEVDEMEVFVDDTGTGAITHVVDDDGSIWAAYGVTSQPAFAFIDADGAVTDVVVGAMGEAALVEQAQALAG